MRKNVLSVIAAILLMLLSAANPADAATVLTGSRSTGGGGLVGFGGWDGIDDAGFQVSWLITQSAAGQPWNYQYTFTGATTDVSGAANPLLKGISHLILELSPGVLEGDLSNIMAGWDSMTYSTDASLVDVATHLAGSSGNPGLLSDVYGVKYELPQDADPKQMTFAFTVNRAPILGNLYVKDGVDKGVNTYVYNAGIASAPVDLYDFNNVNYIVRPDTSAVMVPLPASAWGGLGLIAAVGVVHWRRRLRRCC